MRLPAYAPRSLGGSHRLPAPSLRRPPSLDGRHDQLPACPAPPSAGWPPSPPPPARGRRLRDPGRTDRRSRADAVRGGRHCCTRRTRRPPGGNREAGGLRTGELVQPDHQARRGQARPPADDHLPRHHLRRGARLRRPPRQRAPRRPRRGLDEQHPQPAAGRPGQGSDRLAAGHRRGRQRLRQRASARSDVHHLEQQDLGRLLRRSRLARLQHLRRSAVTRLGQHLPPQPHAHLAVLGRRDGRHLVLERRGGRSGLRPLPSRRSELGVRVQGSQPQPVQPLPQGDGAEGGLHPAQDADHLFRPPPQAGVEGCTRHRSPEGTEDHGQRHLRSRARSRR